MGISRSTLWDLSELENVDTVDKGTVDEVFVDDQMCQSTWRNPLN